VEAGEEVVAGGGLVASFSLAALVLGGGSYSGRQLITIFSPVGPMNLRYRREKGELLTAN